MRSRIFSDSDHEQASFVLGLGLPSGLGCSQTWVITKLCLFPSSWCDSMTSFFGPANSRLLYPSFSRSQEPETSRCVRVPFIVKLNWFSDSSYFQYRFALDISFPQCSGCCQFPCALKLRLLSDLGCCQATPDPDLRS